MMEYSKEDPEPKKYIDDNKEEKKKMIVNEGEEGEKE